MPAWGNRLSDSDIAHSALIHALRGTRWTILCRATWRMAKPCSGASGAAHATPYGTWKSGGAGPRQYRGGAQATAIGDALTKAEHRVYGDGGVHLAGIPPMEYER